MVIQWNTFYKTLLLENTRVKIVLFNNNTIRNTSSGYHPLFLHGSSGIFTEPRKINFVCGETKQPENALQRL